MKFLLALTAFLLASFTAQADCTSPDGVAGKIFFNTAYKVLEYCDGTTWYNLGTPNAAGALGDCTNPASPPGKLLYNTAYNVMQFCNGTSWVNLGTANQNPVADCTSPPSKPGQIFFNASSKTLQYCNGATWVNTGRWDIDANPDPFSFPDLTNQPLSTQVSSSIIQITGLGAIVTTSVSGTTSPQIRVCNDATCSSVQTTWGTSMNITNNKYLQARQTTSGSNSAATAATISIGSLGSSIWTVTTEDDTTPNSYSFTDLTGQNLSTQVTSNIIQISGINISVTTATSGASSEIRTCANSDCSSVLTTWGTSLQIANNQYLQARQTTSGSGSTSTSATVTVGTGTTTWSATTRVNDTAPDSYSFTDLTNQTASTQVNSNIIQISGINMAVTAATSGASSEVRSCSDGACSSVLSTWGSSISIANNQYLQARQTTSSSSGTSTSATITVGTGTTTWSATTTAVTPGSQNFANSGSFVVPNYNTLTVVATKGATGATGDPGYNYAGGGSGDSPTCYPSTPVGGSAGSPGGNSTFASSTPVVNTTTVFTVGQPGAPVPGQSITVTVGAGGAGGAGGSGTGDGWLGCNNGSTGATGATGAKGSVNTSWN